MNSDSLTYDTEALTVTREGDALRLRLRGPWTLHGSCRPHLGAVRAELAAGGPLPRIMRFDVSAVTDYDSALISFLLNCHDLCVATKTQFDFESLPPGPRQLLSLATAVPHAEDVRPNEARQNPLAQLGTLAEELGRDALEILQFCGDCTVAVGRMLLGRARFRWSDVWLEIQHCGADALPIISLLAFLMGLILAYVGAVTLRPYGGLIFIANLVGLAMVREMGVMMTGVIMSGRTGASFAAQLGTMKVSEEISALRALGLSPIEYLVLPRMIALFVMFPLLTIYANFIGMFGGAMVAMTMGLSYAQFTHQLTGAVDLTNFSVGLIKSFFFGLIVAATGCLRGMQCGNSSAAVGIATTRAVVTGITCLVVADAVFAVIFNTLQM
ncbi:MAG TPA: ABC transporter permease [Opitutales bacterium]|nr:ABC transporter permease [Opitutales bacterium]